MRRYAFARTATVALAGGLVSVASMAQEIKRVQPGTSLKVKEEAIASLGAPNDRHALLEQFEGKWTGQAILWAFPGASPINAVGTSTNEMVMGGRFLRTEFTATLPSGESVEAIGFDGYDKVVQRYVGTWVDSMSTSLLVFEGDFDQEGKERRMTCKLVNPVTGFGMEIRTITTLISSDEYRYQSWSKGPEDKFFKTMEISYKREK